jgi:DNA (cytosine-5)-methyltransferase 1
MKMLDLFSGIGGFSLAATWTWQDELKVVSFCEIDPFCQKVLKKHWPNVPCHENIFMLKGDEFGEIDLLTGGFPCQPYSVAGKRKGKEDARALWPEMLRVIKAAKPRWVIGENVAGFINMGLNDCIFDLEGAGYEVQSFVIPACAVKAPHRRDRVWIVANSSCNGFSRTEQAGNNIEKSQRTDSLRVGAEGSDRYDSNPEQSGLQIGQQENGTRIQCIERTDRHATDTTRGSIRPEGRLQEESFNSINTGIPKWDEPWLEVATRLCGIFNGVSDRVHRLKALGNSIVPQVAFEIMKAIKEIDMLEAQGKLDSVLKEEVENFTEYKYTDEYKIKRDILLKRLKKV